jgi:hypothetical protein
MDSLFEPDYLESSPSFLSFSSFADLDFHSSPTWDSFGFTNQNTKSHSDTSSTSSPELGDFPFDIVGAAFEDPPTPADIGIFAGPSKQKSDWQDLPIPSVQTDFTPTSSYAWDEAVLQPTTTPFVPTPHRTTSNPTLSAPPRVPIKSVMSMPSMREEEPSTPSQWLNTDHEDLTENFDWVFSDYGLGAVPTETTIFAAFNEPGPEPEAELPWLPLDEWSFDNYTINPTEIEPRPNSAPRLNAGLSVPTADIMAKR